MFHTLLIANRGEIACRIIATARAMGLRSVAIHTEVDDAAPHVAMADTAIRIPGYLDGAAIIAAAQTTGAQAIHPGYGFLSENADFAGAVAAAGLTFVGPPPQAIRAMGLKDAAKATMARHNVPTIPGESWADGETPDLDAVASRVGFPLLIKARAGGGGKGMRRVDRPEDLAEAFAAAGREAKAAFGDAACLIERFIETPRHIEIQVLADGHGTTLHLMERDCSLQRRHQKVIEEAPAPGMTAAMRSAMGKAAIEAARAVGYVGAGTVEFIVDTTRGLNPDSFYFLEMNTRLQVEHPVTEAITGLDLVEWQIRIAAGEPLPFAQSDIPCDGWAVEARLYAEDPARDFLPAPGMLHAFEPPAGAASFTRAPLRVDVGVSGGRAIPPDYDPMIAKVIAHAPTREDAFDRLHRALGDTVLAGPPNNLAFLRALLAHPQVRQGDVETGLIARDIDTLTDTPEPDAQTLALAAWATLGLDEQRDTDTPWNARDGWRPWGDARHDAGFTCGGAEHHVAVTFRHDGRLSAATEAGVLEFSVSGAGDAFRLHAAGTACPVRVIRDGTALFIHLNGATWRVNPDDPVAALSETGPAGDTLTAPMPGLLSDLACAPGDAVEEGQVLARIEAMKMEHPLRAPRDGVVKATPSAPGTTVADGAVIVALEPLPGT